LGINIGEVFFSKAFLKPPELITNIFCPSDKPGKISYKERVVKPGTSKMSGGASKSGKSSLGRASSPDMGSSSGRDSARSVGMKTSVKREKRHRLTIFPVESIQFPYIPIIHKTLNSYGKTAIPT
jgi:hypothetical protein